MSTMDKLQMNHLQFAWAEGFESTIGILKIHRPQALNALNAELLEELDQWIHWSSQQTKLRAVVVTGEGEKAFAAGADIKSMQTLNGDAAYKMSRRGQEIFRRLEMTKFVTIAAVNGFALGGGLELALSCDFIIASEKAKLGLPEVSLGLIPGYGGTQRLWRLIGPAKAKLMTLTGEAITAQEAFQMGLVARCAPPTELISECLKIATMINKKSPLAVHFAKTVIDHNRDADAKSADEFEAQYFSKAFQTQDHHEGIQAFLEKRSAQFKGE